MYSRVAGWPLNPLCYNIFRISRGFIGPVSCRWRTYARVRWREVAAARCTGHPHALSTATCTHADRARSHTALIALRDALERRGVLDQLKARVRAEVFDSLDDPDDVKPRLSHENLLVNELIREYLEYNNYRHTLQVFLPETGQPSAKIDRRILAEKTVIQQELVSSGEAGPPGQPIPLLYGLLSSSKPASEATFDRGYHSSERGYHSSERGYHSSERGYHSSELEYHSSELMHHSSERGHHVSSLPPPSHREEAYTHDAVSAGSAPAPSIARPHEMERSLRSTAVQHAPEAEASPSQEVNAPAGAPAPTQVRGWELAPVVFTAGPST
ncbi:hypothetical protein AB1Y20_020772 [Prymnesium parvum]|uniref:FGFR1 oncogene partner (FOP) N-terminal dimerisation domain-containing protein n=1 Tax=Prymnesium parvum TaxID=97485 RepID=A0AB34JZ09_PRYPA